MKESKHRDKQLVLDEIPDDEVMASAMRGTKKTQQTLSR